MKCVNKRCWGEIWGYRVGGKNNRKGKQQESINTTGNTNTKANKQRCRYRCRRGRGRGGRGCSSGFKCRCTHDGICIFQRISKHIKSKANGQLGKYLKKHKNKIFIEKRR